MTAIHEPCCTTNRGSCANVAACLRKNSSLGRGAGHIVPPVYILKKQMTTALASCCKHGCDTIALAGRLADLSH